ncbi:MAG: LysR family transcriptional regulator [Acutalibacteraceae bacterium]|nr:LysR family transcriptional regulator [Acutalibacteraceae bacterium]
MNILHLKYAVEIANKKSISRAAENLYMGQPNLSRAIKELEENLKITIFNRTPKGITITPEGEEFLQYARRIVNQVDEVEEIYKNGRKPKQDFSVCVPRASYISYAFAEFAKGIKTDIPADVFYKETNSSRTIGNVIKGEYNLGIVRFQTAFERYFKSMFEEKHLNAEIITDFKYVLLMSKNHPLSAKKEIYCKDLAPYIEITHADPYVPSLPIIDVKKEELSKYVDKHIYVFERGSQFEILKEVENSFMWVSPIPDDLYEKYGLVAKECVDNEKVYVDVLIYRNGYKLTELDNAFITAVCDAKRKYI